MIKVAAQRTMKAVATGKTSEFLLQVCKIKNKIIRFNLIRLH